MSKQLLVGFAAALLGCGAALLAPLVSADAPRAEALGVCSTQVENAIFTATGENTGQDNVGTAGLACNPYLYNRGQWSTQSELDAYVSTVMNRCGNTTSGRYLVLAILETTGIPPAASADNLCNQSIYDTWVDDTSQGGVGTINWNEYSGNPGVTGPGLQFNVAGAVNGVMQVCNRSSVSHAVASVTNHYARTEFPEPPERFVSVEAGLMGQCNPTLYRNAAWEGYGDLKSLVQTRNSSTQNCANSDITTAYVAISGWKPISGECDATRYANGNWSTGLDLRNKVYHSLRCIDPWVGQFYAYDISAEAQRRVRGYGWGTGECNARIYGVPPFVSYNDYRSRVLTANGAIVSAGADIENDGDLNIGATEYPAAQVILASTFPTPEIGTLGGGRFIATNGGMVIASGGGNVIASGGGNIIASGGGNVIASGGGNIISEAGGAVIASGGGN